jgi:hypothetical protein
MSGGLPDAFGYNGCFCLFFKANMRKFLTVPLFVPLAKYIKEKIY